MHGVSTVTFGGGKLWPSDGLGGLSVDWGNRYLVDSATTTKVNWETGILADSAGSPSLDWENRALTEPTNTYTAFAYDNSIHTTSDLYHRTIIQTPVQSAISDTPLYVGQVIEATIAGGVTDYQLVFLDTDGTWYATKAGVGYGADKMLGIAVDVASQYVLIEGDVGVSDDNSQGGYVVGADHGLPVYVSGATGQMTTTAPSGANVIVRIVGHIYYQSSNDVNWWKMKFRPSSDWYEQ